MFKFKISNILRIWQLILSQKTIRVRLCGPGGDGTNILNPESRSACQITYTQKVWSTFGQI